MICFATHPKLDQKQRYTSMTHRRYKNLPPSRNVKMFKHNVCMWAGANSHKLDASWYDRPHKLRAWIRSSWIIRQVSGNVYPLTHMPTVRLWYHDEAFALALAFSAAALHRSLPNFSCANRARSLTSFVDLGGTGSTSYSHSINLKSHGAHLNGNINLQLGWK